MDWDGIGTFALFMSMGGLGVAAILFEAYKARLAARLEQARIEAGTAEPTELQEQVERLESHVLRLNERLDFTERLLERGEAGPGMSSDAGPGPQSSAGSEALPGPPSPADPPAPRTP